MKERFGAIFNAVFFVVKNVFIATVLFWIVVSLADIKLNISAIQAQNRQAYDVNAVIFTKIISTFQVFGNYVQNLASVVEQENLKPDYEYMKARTVYLVQKYENEDYVSIGTGVVIKIDEENKETYILTNKHVCEFSDDSVCFVFQDDNKYKVTLVKKSEFDHDIQVVKANVIIPNKEVVKGLKDVKPQDKVYMVGHNLGNPYMYSEGTVSGFMRGTNDLLVGMPAGPGNSGSAIFTQDGYVAGILYAGQVIPYGLLGGSMDTSHGICVNSKVLRLFLSEYFE